MTKNITISVQEELATKMEKFPDVNWSEVCRTAISSYIQTRSHPHIEAIISKLRTEQDEEFALGYKVALEVANKTSYTVVDRIYRAIDEELTKENWDNYWGQIDIEIGNEAWQIINQGSSTAFIDGFFKGIIEIHRKIQKKD